MRVCVFDNRVLEAIANIQDLRVEYRNGSLDNYTVRISQLVLDFVGELICLKSSSDGECEILLGIVHIYQVFRLIKRDSIEYQSNWNDRQIEDISTHICGF